MLSEKIDIVKVLPNDNQLLLDIGYSTFYDAFGPPVNSEENIQNYLQEKFTLKQINEELSNPNSDFYFAKIENKVVGYLKLNIDSAQTEHVEGNGLEIERIYVIKEYQGKKIGQYLLQKSLEIARQRSNDFIWLGVWDQNTAAIKFYERHNFIAFNKHQFMLGTDIQTDIMMKYEL